MESMPVHGKDPERCSVNTKRQSLFTFIPFFLDLLRLIASKIHRPRKKSTASNLGSHDSAKLEMVTTIWAAEGRNSSNQIEAMQWLHEALFFPSGTKDIHFFHGQFSG